MMPIDALLPLAVFLALVLTLALHGLAASGHFPREYRAPAFASGFGQALLFGSIAAAIVCLIIAIIGAWRLIPWYAAIIGGGLAILCAPLVLQRFPDRFVNGRGALLAFAGASVLLALLLFWFR
jgi:hypothetical protein